MIDKFAVHGHQSQIRRIYHEKYENFEECDKAVSKVYLYSNALNRQFLFQVFTKIF